jgi:hypothetical protein
MKPYSDDPASRLSEEDLSPAGSSNAERSDPDGFVKSPSAALRFTFVVAAYQQVRFTPQVLRALHMELFTLPSQF